MMDALEKVEKEIKKPLMRNDKNGMGLLLAEFDKINKKYASLKQLFTSFLFIYFLTTILCSVSEL